jgi:hypothetical protein
MSVYDLFSKRQKRLRGEIPDVYSYKDLPSTLRVQIVHIIRDAFGENIPYTNNYTDLAYKNVNDILCREYGIFSLTENPINPGDSVLKFLLACKNIEQVLDVVEISFREMVPKNWTGC